MKYYGQLREQLLCYYHAIGIPLEIVDENGDVVERFGDVCRYCSMLRLNPEIDEWCRELHGDGGEQSAAYGGCYFFTCHGNMVHFSVALLDRGKYVGSVLAGPIILDRPDLGNLREIMNTCNVSSRNQALLISSMKDIPMIDSARVNYLGELLYNLIYSTLRHENEVVLEKRKMRGVQQEMIAQSIHEIKNTDYTRDYQQQQEIALADMIEQGDLEHAYVLLNDILGGIYFSSGNNVEMIKIRITELITILSRRLLRQGVFTDEIFDLVNRFHKNSAHMDDVLDLSQSLAELLRQFVDIINRSVNSDVSDQVRDGLLYIHKNYRGELTLVEVAKHVAVTPTYFSKCFKEQMGMGFAEYLMELRVQKAKELLEQSALSLAEVAQATGFNSQQYFSRIFKRKMEITPGEYRNRKV